MRRLLHGTGALALAVAAAGTASAAKLEKAECDALKSELVLLTTTGVKADMARGPDWAKANLAPERLVQVKRLIEIEEQLAFRCEALRPPPEAKAPEGAPGKTPAQPAKTRRARAAAKAEAAPAPIDGDSAGTIIGENFQQPSAAQPKPRKKAKAARRAKRKPDAAQAQ